MAKENRAFCGRRKKAMLNNSRVENELYLAALKLVKVYRQYNPKGNYLNLSFLQIDEMKGRIHINNAFYDRDHLHPIDISEDIPL